ncbi:MAG: hypothetical protein U9Q04_08395 [Campylobacterota bacterium]|nr:hypothetical protein [Campylobacterota bacterium]
MKKFVYRFMISTALVAAGSVSLLGDDDISELTNEVQVQKAQNLAENTQEVTEAKINLADAQEAYDNDPENEELKEALDNAIQQLADMTDESVNSINDMRESGMGWGEIAHELGVHPSVLGLGHTNNIKNQERMRETKSFKTSNQNRSENSSNKLKGKSSDSKDKGNSGNKDKGNSSNKGNGKDKN